MKPSAFSALYRVGIFGSLDVDALVRTIEAVRHQFKRYGRNAVIHFQGDPYTGLMVLLSGEVDALMQDFDGKTLKIESMKGPELLAPGILFAEDPAFPVAIEARSEVELLVLPKPSVEAIGRRYPDFLLSLLRDSGNRIALLSRKLRLAQFTTLRQKVAGYVLDCARKQGTEAFMLEHTKVALAELFGAASPSVSRTFSELRASGLIELDGKMVYILDRDGLRRVVSVEDIGAGEERRP
jgi:CRP/FNR family transcriptional regulator, dissimilatory nitrate respiration regulator